MNTRTEAPLDFAPIRALHLKSFPDPGEADLVDQLRQDNDAVISLVAEDDKGVVIAHGMLSKMSAPFRALGLAPVATLEAFRRKGIAAELINSALEQAKNDGWQGVFVLGNPDYYQRFGFDLALAAGFSSPYAGPHFMALALQDGGLPVISGRVEYAKAFDGLD